MNSAIDPKPKLEADFYDWYARHEEKLQLVQAQPEARLVFIGDSITHLFEVENQGGPRGAVLWRAHFGAYAPINLGFGWDRTQNVLWRLDHGEMAGLQPGVVVLLIGTNNLTGTANAPTNTPAEIVEGIAAIEARIRALSPATELLLMAVLPRGFQPTDPLRAPIAELNTRLAAWATDRPQVTLVDCGAGFLDAAGCISPTLMNDGCHPTEAGYRIWADAIAPHLHRLLG